MGKNIWQDTKGGAIVSAIYQRARPINWEQVVGQEQVKGVLRGALEQGRVGHAYLFSGPRGVGKTTTARLIAMTANCQSAGSKPCGECESCLSVRAGNHPDVLEIDAASNNGVDDVRDLREKVGLSAMRGGKKIYILDEAHMMTKAAFNALLKTLEEPPEHVIFILATTEPEKILPTIMSRCQHYRFRRLTDDEIAGKLQLLAQQEGVPAEADALQLIGRLADGAMRDGESLLERMLASGEAITRTGVEQALGLPPSERMRGMAAALVQQDTGTLLAGAAALYRDGFAARTVVDGLVSTLAEALHAKLGLGGEPLEGADIPTLLSVQAALDEQSSRFARAADQQSLELALTHALMAAHGVQAAPRQSSPAAQSGAATSQAHLDQDNSADLLRRLSALERELSAWRAAAPEVARLSPISPATPTVPTSPTLPAADSEPTPAPPRTSARATGEIKPGGNWADVVQKASMQMRAFLKPARMHAEAGYVSLSYDAKGKFHAKQVYDKFDAIGELVMQVFGAVTFELISPDHNRKQVLGRAPQHAHAATAPAIVPDIVPAVEPLPRPPAVTQNPAARPTHLPAELPDFEPTRRSSPSARSQTPTSNPQTSAAPNPATPNPATQGKIMPPSPDDAAAAPLPQPAHSKQQHAADTPPEPVEAGPPTAQQPAEVFIPSEPYVPPEAPSQEPVWDDGPPLEPESFHSAEAVTAAPASAPRPAAAQPATPPRRDDIAPSTPALGLQGPGAAIRNHPNYQEVTRLFSGRIKEMGTVKKVTDPTPEAQDSEVQEDEEGQGGALEA